MCIDHTCDSKATGRRAFIIGAAATAASIRGLQAQGADSQAKQPETRVLDNPNIVHGRVTFKHGGKDTIDGYIARPKADSVYFAVLVIAGNRITEEYIPNT